MNEAPIEQFKEAYELAFDSIQKSGNSEVGWNNILAAQELLSDSTNTQVSAIVQPSDDDKDSDGGIWESLHSLESSFRPNDDRLAILEGFVSRLMRSMQGKDVDVQFVQNLLDEVAVRVEKLSEDEAVQKSTGILRQRHWLLQALQDEAKLRGIESDTLIRVIRDVSAKMEAANAYDRQHLIKQKTRNDWTGTEGRGQNAA